MIEILNGIQETVKFKEDTNLRLYNNDEARITPNTGMHLWKLSCPP